MFGFVMRFLGRRGAAGMDQFGEAVAGQPVMAWFSSAVLAIGTFALFAWCVSKLGNYSPFLYFQF